MATKTEEVTERQATDCGGMKIEPQKEHQWLQKFVGDWTCEGEAMMEPGKPPIKWTATESIRSVGDIWTVAEGKGEMPEPATTLLTLGYDPQKKRFVGTFMGSMMTNLWVYEGSLDASGNVLTLDTEGPNMAAQGKLAKYQDIFEIKSNDHRILRSRMQGEDDKWNEVMTATYRRKK